MDDFASTANRPNVLPGPQLNKPFSTSEPFRGNLLPKNHAYLTNMAAPTPMTDSGLIGVALIIRSKEGPRWVFHYPPHPTLDVPQRDENLYGTDLVEEPMEDEEDDDDYDFDESDLEGEDAKLAHKFSRFGVSLTKNFMSRSSSGHVQEPADIKDDEHYDDKWGKQHVPWEHVFEFGVADLESILTPAKVFHKKKFELSLDPYHFITYPIHIREDGRWKKKKAKRSKKGKEEQNEEGGDGASDKKAANNSSENGDEHGGMTMFNVVFMLNAERQKIDEKITSIYEHVAKNLNKALHHAQAHSDYVWKESEMILALKEKAKEERRPMSWLWSEIAIRSTLAAAIRDVYVAVSENKIATVQLGYTTPLNLSLQIPVPYFLKSLPSPSERATPGLLVTGADPWVTGDGEEVDETHLDQHFALILVDDEDKIIAEITNDNTDISIPLLHCIRICHPTLSFAQAAKAHSFTLDSLLQFATHLIHYRRAIAVPPIHASQFYMVNPNCDSRKLPEASVAWEKKFPLSPSLPQFLSKISITPKKYKDYIPSRDHRPTYLDMLAWLIRGGWVVQVRTFAWILVWPEIIYEVEYQLKGEAIEKAKKKAASSQSNSGESAGETDESGTDKKDVDPNAPMTTEEVAELARLYRLEQKAAQNAIEAAAEFAKMPVPVATEHPSMNEGEHLDDLAPYIIKDPHKVTHEESLYIAAIGKRFKDEDREMWGKLIKYFNGDEALEMIALKEDMKRKLVWSYLATFQEHLVAAKHF